MVARTLRDLPKDLDKNISRDFNALIKKVHRTLSTKKHSPVYTGFFASSWQAQGSPVRATDFHTTKSALGWYKKRSHENVSC